jgi:Na+/H+-dicarboxylate symporter
MPLAFPSIEAGSFFSTSLVEIAEVDFIDLYIPVNPFSSITRRVVPAAAVFSVTFGIALIGVENKQSQLEILVATSKTLTRIAMMVIKITPFGVFAIASDATGIIDLSGKRPNFSLCVIHFKYLFLCPGYVQLKMTGFLSRILEIHLRLPGHLSIIPKRQS